MSCFINPVMEDRCVYLNYEGTLSPIEIMAARYEASATLAKKRWNRIVVDISRLKSELTDRALFEMSSSISLELSRSVRVAVVTGPEQAVHTKFLRNVARNDGVFLTSFSNAEEAAAWVKGMPACEQCPPRSAVRHS